VLDSGKEDAAASIAVIEQLQGELRAARSEGLVLQHQRDCFHARLKGLERGDDGVAPAEGAGLVSVTALLAARSEALDAKSRALALQEDKKALTAKVADLSHKLHVQVRELSDEVKV